MKIALAADHAGFELKENIKNYLLKNNYEVEDYGTFSREMADYPDYIIPAALDVSAGACDLGVVCGGSGNGEAIAANKVVGIRCALCWNTQSALLARQHNNANMIALGERMMSIDEGIAAVEAWLKAEFEEGRHVRRLEKIAHFEDERGLF